MRTARTPSATAVKGPDVGQARRLMVLGADVGKGWKDDVGEVPVGERSAGSQKFCYLKSLPSDDERTLLVFSPVTDRDASFPGVRHDLTAYKPGGAATAFAELDAALKSCRRATLTDGSIWSLTRVAPGRGKITIRLAGYKDGHEGEAELGAAVALAVALACADGFVVGAAIDLVPEQPAVE